MKTTRIVPYDEKERDEEEQDLKEAGWIWLTDPDGRVFFLNKDTGEKSWNHPLRVEVQPEESSEEDRKLFRKKETIWQAKTTKDLRERNQNRSKQRRG